jgi:TRAP-type C4-dicarboxylate transport system permease small subunit
MGCLCSLLWARAYLSDRASETLLDENATGVYQILDKLSHYLVRFTEVIASVLFIVLLSVVSLAVIDRFVLHFGIFWTEELARFLFIWLGFLTGAIMVRRRGHFSVPYLIDKLLDDRKKQYLDILITCMMLGLMVVLVVYGVKLAEFARYQISPALRISMSYVYYSVPVCGLMMIFFWITHLYHSLRNLEQSRNKPKRAS